MNAIERSFTLQNDSNNYDRSWALKQNLFKNFEPEVIQNNFLNNREENFAQDEYKNLRFSFNQNPNYEEEVDGMEFSFYDNLLHTFSQENKKAMKKKNKKLNKTAKIEEEVQDTNKGKKKNSILINNMDNFENINQKNKSDKREVKFNVELPKIPLVKNNSDNKLKSMGSTKNLPTKNEIEKSHQTVCGVNIIKRKNSNFNNPNQNFPNHLIVHKKHETNENSIINQQSVYKKEISVDTSKKMSEGDSKEKKLLKQLPSKKNVNHLSSGEPLSPMLYKPQTKFSKKSMNSKNSKNSKNSRNSKNLSQGDLNGNNLGMNSNDTSNMANSKEEEKRKGKNFFGILCCLPFCKN